MASAIRANKEVAKRNLAEVLDSYGVYGVGCGYTGHQIDTDELVERLVKGQELIIELLKKAKG